MLYLTLFFRVLCHLLTISAPHLEKGHEIKRHLKTVEKLTFAEKFYG